MDLRDQILGMFVGGAIGDALGMPVETWTPERIREVHPKGVNYYVSPVDHKWFSCETPTGTITDDTQLTLAVAEGMIEGHAKFVETGDFEHYLDAIAIQHALAMKESVHGWGKTTIEAVRRLTNGVHWNESGKTTESMRGTGNGVPMKCSPMAAWCLTPVGRENLKKLQFNQFLVDFSAITHFTKVSAFATIFHTTLLTWAAYQFPISTLFTSLPHTVRSWELDYGDEGWYADHLYQFGFDELYHNLEHIHELPLECFGPDSRSITLEQMYGEFGGGSCYIADSLPYAYMWYAHQPKLEGILNAVNGGGDADTNAKLVGDIVGIRNGLSYFNTPMRKWTLQGLRDYQKILEVGNRFCDTFGVP